jgi:Holliday junction resolvasome RuvABC endonuclease subunit
MAVLGFRCETKEVWWALLEGDRSDPRIVARDRIRIPQNLTRPRELAELRKELRDLLRTRTPIAVAYKKTEGNAQRFAARRIEAEAVLQEVAAAQGVPTIEAAVKRQLKTRVAVAGDARYVGRAADSQFPGETFSTEAEKEAVLAAWGVLPQGG